VMSVKVTIDQDSSSLISTGIYSTRAVHCDPNPNPNPNPDPNDRT